MSFTQVSNIAVAKVGHPGIKYRSSKSAKKFKPLRIYIHIRLNFDYLDSRLCKKAGRVITCSGPKFQILNTLQHKLIINTFVISHFSYSIREKKLTISKNKIKVWTNDSCLCKYYKNYIGQVGFI